MRVMSKLKVLVRKPSYLLAQVIHRLSEKSSLDSTTEHLSTFNIPTGPVVVRLTQTTPPL